MYYQNFAIFDQNFDKMSIGSKVRNYRYAQKLSQRTLADMVDVSQSEISSIESDKSKPNSVILNRIAKALDVVINDLLVDDSIAFPGNVMEVILSNQEKIMNLQEKITNLQEKITNLIEVQNKLIESQRFTLKKPLICYYAVIFSLAFFGG